MRSRRARKRLWKRRWQGWLDQWYGFDWLLFVLPIGLTVLGAILIGTQRQDILQGYWLQHLVLGGVGVLIALLISQWNYRNLLAWHWLVYVLTNGALLAVMFVGSSALGAQRWIPIAGFNVQPSEFAKVGVMISISALLQAQPATNLWAIGRVLAVTLVPWALVFLQPDLGTSLVFGMVTLGMLYWAKARLGWVVLMLAPLVSAIVCNLTGQYPIFFAIAPVWLGLVALLAGLHFVPRLWAVVGALGVNLGAAGFGSVLWNSVLKDYQKERLVLFLNPDLDPLGGGYHLIQSRIAIGAGGFWGRGLNQATQTNLNFIPEQHTDFIFSAAAEVYGFLGSVLILFAFWLICFRLIRIALTTRDNFGSLLSIGILSMLVFQIVINIGMNVGLAPVTGIPLPWLSYGRSALMTNFIALGLVESVALHRHL